MLKRMSDKHSKHRLYLSSLSLYFLNIPASLTIQNYVICSSHFFLLFCFFRLRFPLPPLFYSCLSKYTVNIVTISSSLACLLFAFQNFLLPLIQMQVFFVISCHCLYHLLAPISLIPQTEEIIPFTILKIHTSFYIFFYLNFFYHY